MAGERKISIVISAEDDYSAKLRKFNEALTASGNAAGGLSNSADKLTREFGKLGDMNELAAAGLRRFGNVLQGMAFGAVMGVVSAFTEEMIRQYKATTISKEKIDELNKSVMDQATAWKILPGPINSITKATIDLYNAQLLYDQHLERNKGKEMEHQIELTEKAKAIRQAAMGKVVGPLAASIRETWKTEILEADVTLAELNKKLDDWHELMKLKTVDNVSSISAAAKEALKAPSGTNFLTAFIAGDLDMAAVPKFALAGTTIGEKFGESFIAGAKTTVENAGDRLDFSSMRDIARFDSYADYVQKYLALTEEKYQREGVLDDMALTRSLALSEQRYKTELQAEQAILSMKFAAGNQSVALLSIVGQKHKAAALAALAFQKGLAIAQVYIQAKTAQAAAIAPPPLGLGPVFGAGLAATIEGWSWVTMGLIAATGIAEAAMKGGGGPSGIGGGGGVGALPIQPPDILTPTGEVRPTQNITFIVQSLDPSSVNWDKLMEDNIKPALERLSGEGNMSLNIKVFNS